MQEITELSSTEPTTPLRGSLSVVPAPSAPAADSYRRLAHVFHEVLSEQSLDSLLERIADTLSDLIPHDSMTIYEADETHRVLRPVLARDPWAEKIMASFSRYGQGITGWAIEHQEPVLANEAHRDPRVSVVPGTPADEPEALISVPLIARGQRKGALNIYRLGEDAAFSAEEFELAQLFGDAAALALDNAQVKARLEHQASTDSLTGLYNHRTFHERLRAELTRASRTSDHVALLMLDIDDFKRLNDVHGHGTGDEILIGLSELLRALTRDSDVVCRVGGEEFAVIMPSCDAGDALGLARRLTDALGETDFDTAGRLTVSVGVSQGPEHAMNPRELVACAEAAMMTAKVRGKNAIVLFDEDSMERPVSHSSVREVAHLKMLQSLAGKLNRLNEVAAIGDAIAAELRTLIDYHNCRVFVIDGQELVPVAFRGEFATRGGEAPKLIPVPMGFGVTGTAASTGQSLLLNDAANAEFAQQVEGTEKIDESVIATPLRYGSRVIGVILISKLGLGQFDEDDVRLLEVLAGHASVALENARLYEAQRREAVRARETAETAGALLEFGRELATASGLDEVLARIVRLSSRILVSARTSVWLQESEDGEVVLLDCHGYEESAREELAAITFDAAQAQRLMAASKPFVLDADLMGSLRGERPRFRRRYLVAPINVDGRPGAIATALARGEEPQPAKLELLSGLAYQAKLAIESSSNFLTLERTFLSTVEALANALEANDEYTSSHARWITDRSVEVGRALGLDTQSLKRVELGALFHDIGKIGVPAHILQKPGPLTEEERMIVEQHPELGARILAPIERLADVRDIVRSCHERWDGAGYPDGKHGEEIPLESRIVFVCDAFHAMTTDRPYRKALSESEARRRLREAAGTQFDPQVVDAFLSA
jgi:diguanylate cyclase (GGDEF)-like protein